MNITVVIPTLNEEENLPHCLRALETQVQDDDEIIVVDGGSEDRTQEMAEDADGVRLFVPADDEPHGPNIGQARHIGTDKANNEIIAQTDADAIPPDGWLETIRLHFETNEDLVVLWGTVEDKNGVPIRNLTGKFWSLFGGTSGNNTAYRKSSYEELKKGYPKWNYAEDFGIIAKLAMKGEAKRDDEMVMRMNMDRKRYQTQPLLMWSVASIALGRGIGGETGQMLTGAGVGLGGTEVTYETIAKKMRSQDGERTHPHHDELAVSLAGMGSMLSGGAGRMISGAGAGMFAHHLLTEGVSFAPTELEQHSEQVR